VRNRNYEFFQYIFCIILIAVFAYGAFARKTISSDKNKRIENIEKPAAEPKKVYVGARIISTIPVALAARLRPRAGSNSPKLKYDYDCNSHIRGAPTALDRYFCHTRVFPDSKISKSNKGLGDFEIVLRHAWGAHNSYYIDPSAMEPALAYCKKMKNPVINKLDPVAIALTSSVTKNDGTYDGSKSYDPYTLGWDKDIFVDCNRNILHTCGGLGCTGVAYNKDKSFMILFRYSEYEIDNFNIVLNELLASTINFTIYTLPNDQGADQF
jgi:hypothetical protein